MDITNNAYGPGTGMAAPINLRNLMCPCGEDLGMRDPEEKPTCGDPACAKYLKKHPDWYEVEK